MDRDQAIAALRRIAAGDGLEDVQHIIEVFDAYASGVQANCARELHKVADVLELAARHFDHQGKADAALHLAEPRFNPLAAKVMQAASEARVSAGRLER